MTNRYTFYNTVCDWDEAVNLLQGQELSRRNALVRVSEDRIDHVYRGGPAGGDEDIILVSFLKTGETVVFPDAIGAPHVKPKAILPLGLSRVWSKKGQIVIEARNWDSGAVKPRVITYTYPQGGLVVNANRVVANQNPVVKLEYEKGRASGYGKELVSKGWGDDIGIWKQWRFYHRKDISYLSHICGHSFAPRSASMCGTIGVADHLEIGRFAPNARSGAAPDDEVLCYSCGAKLADEEDALFAWEQYTMRKENE